MRLRTLTIVAPVVLSLVAATAYATPSSIILIPSTDTVEEGAVHMDLDTLFTVGQGAGNSSALSIGATYGVTEDLEVGFDWLSDTSTPVVGNVKWRPWSNDEWSVVVGAWLLGDASTSGSNQVYGLVSHDCSAGRFAVGYATGSTQALAPDESQFWFSYDKTLNDDWWLGADYVSGDSWLGSANVGVGYAVSDNVGLILGYNHYNAAGTDDTLTMQVDVSF